MTPSRPCSARPQPDPVLWTALPVGLGLSLAAVLPDPLVWPALSLLFLAGAAVMAGVAWLRAEPASATRLTIWDLSGLLVFFGVAAGLLADPEEVLPFIEARRTR